MRKVNPVDLCSDFQLELDALNEFRTEMGEHIVGTAGAAGRLSTLHEVVFHRGCVALESFLSAYLIGCVNRDATTFMEFRRGQIWQSVGAKYTDWDLEHLAYGPPQHPSLADVTGLLDGADENLAFGSFEQLAAFAQPRLAPEWYDRITATPVERRAIVDMARAIRNCVAHQSVVSFRRMNEAIEALPEVGNAGLLRRQVNAVRNVGAYLKAYQGERTRTRIIFDEFWALAEALK